MVRRWFSKSVRAVAEPPLFEWSVAALIVRRGMLFESNTNGFVAVVSSKLPPACGGVHICCHVYLVGLATDPHESSCAWASPALAFCIKSLSLLSVAMVCLLFSFRKQRKQAVFVNRELGEGECKMLK